MNSDFVCECGKDFTGSSCELPVQPNQASLHHRAVPLRSNQQKNASTRAENGNESSPSCVERTLNDFYVDPQTGCKSKRKIKTLKCKSECSVSPKQSLNLLGNKTPFGYIIGTNKHILRSLNSNGGSESCCQASRVKKRKIKLFCADGSTLMTELSIVKRCTCFAECSSQQARGEFESKSDNKLRMLRHSYDVQV